MQSQSEGAVRGENERVRRRLAELEQIYASAPVGLCVLDGDLRYLQVNAHAARVIGLPAAELVGRTVQEMAPDFAAQAASAMETLRASTESWIEFETTGRTAEGGPIRYWNNRWVALRDAEGRFTGASIVFDEITERRQSLEALRESERIYRGLGESLQWGIWICDAQGRNIHASESILRLVGKTPQEYRDYGWVDSIHPEDRALLESWNQSVRQEDPWESELRYLGADGHAYPVLVRCVPVRDDNGKLLCWAGISLDLRSTKETEAALAQKVSEFETLFRALPVAVGVSHDPDCAVVRANPAFADLLGTPAEDNVSKSSRHADRLPFRVLKDGQEVPPQELPMQVAARTGRDVRNFLLEIERADGVRLIEYGHAAPLINTAGKITGAIGVFLDLTELTEAQREIARANQELRRVNEDLRQFAFAATHDLQEPLRILTLYSTLFARSWAAQDHERTGHAVRQIQESAHRMQELLRDLLEYIQVATRGEENLEPVDLNAVLSAVRLQLAAAIEETSAEIEAGPLPVLAGHPVHFAQLLQNLIGNAIKYRGEEAPRIRITAVKKGEAWEFAVADNGIGIEPEYRSTIFGIFKRLHGRTIPGTGIGLAICQRVVERYGGRIWVESEVGRGSTFHFTLVG